MVTRGVRVKKGDGQGVQDQHVHTAMFKIHNQQDLTVYYAAQYYVTTKMGKEFEKEQIHVYV